MIENEKRNKAELRRGGIDNKTYFVWNLQHSEPESASQSEIEGNAAVFKVGKVRLTCLRWSFTIHASLLPALFAIKSTFLNSHKQALSN